MTDPAFDPAQALKIDLARGQLTLLGSSGRLLVPVEALIDLMAAASSDAVAAFGASIGTEIGRRMADRLGSAIERASVELFLQHLGGELALTGLGNLTVERWGRALVLCVEGTRDAKPLELLMVSLIEAALQRSLSRDVAVIRLAKSDAVLRCLVAGRHARADIQRWLDEGLTYGDVLTRLHAVGASAAGASADKGGAA